MKNFYIIIGAVAVVGVAVVALMFQGDDVAREPVVVDVTDEELVDLAQGRVYGDPNAPITIMEFGNYQCPACMIFALQIKPQLDLAYIEAGQAKLVYHDFPTAGLPHSFVAARAARCAGDQDRYFEYHDEVYRTQREWSVPNSPVGHFKDLADDLDLDTQAFDACLESDRHADVVSADLELGLRLGVTGTPTIFVHDGGPPFQKLSGSQFLDIQQAVEAITGN